MLELSNTESLAALNLCQETCFRVVTNFTQGCHCQLDVKFIDFSRTFSNKFKDLLYQIKRAILKSFTILFINSTMSFIRFVSGGKSSLRFCFQT